MSIRIVPESERSPGVEYIAPVRLPDARLPYTLRAARLRALADGHAMADYLLWAADLADAQQAVAEVAPLTEAEVRSLAEALRQPHAPLHSHGLQRSAHWLQLLDGLLAQLASPASMQSAPIQQALAALRSADSDQRNRWASALLAVVRTTCHWVSHRLHCR